MDFLHKPFAWFSKLYQRVQSKSCGRNSFFYFSFQTFFRLLSEKNIRLLAKKLQKVVKTTFCVSRRTICGLNFFLKFWIVLDFLQKPLSWFSKVYLRVQSKNCGRNSFLIFLLRIFFGFWAKIFSHFFPKNFKVLSELHSACPEEQFVTWNFFSVLNLFGFSAETFGMLLKFLSTCPE